MLKRQNKGGIIVEARDYLDPEIEKEMRALGVLQPAEATKIDFYNIKNSGKGDYLGYTILRPQPPDKTVSLGRVGETVIETPEDKGNLQSFLTCGTEIPIRGKTFTTYPFFQQHWSDKWQCGFANLRMFSKWLKHNKGDIFNNVPEEYKDISFPEIGVLADLKKEEEFRVKDFERVLKKMGFRLLKYRYNKPPKIASKIPPPEQIVYSYIESGIPVFLIFGTELEKTEEEKEERKDAHVVSVIGHTFEPDAWWPEAEKDYYARLFGRKYLRSTAWVDFIIHDDNYGPFLTMPKEFLKIDPDIYKAPEYLKDLPIDIQKKLEKERLDRIRKLKIWEVIVPFRKDIRILAEVAEAIAFKAITSEFWISEDTSKYTETTTKWKDRLLQHLKNGNLVLRTFLVKTSDLSKVFPAKKKIMAQEVFFPEKNNPIPRLIWFVEISIPELFAHGGYRLGEVVVDPMCSPQEAAKDYLRAIRYIHLPGIIQLVLKGWRENYGNFTR